MNKHIIPVVIIITISLIVVIAVSGNNHFKQNAGKLATRQDIDSVILDKNYVNSRKGEYFLLSLDQNFLVDNSVFSGSLNAEIGSLSDKEVIKELRRVKGKIVISGNQAICSRAWIILSQFGFSNIYILSSESNPEVLKYEFRSDTLVRPEFR